MAKIPSTTLINYLNTRQAETPYADKEQAVNSLVKHFGIGRQRAVDVVTHWWPDRQVSTPTSAPPIPRFTWSPQAPVSPPANVSFDASTSECSAPPCTYEWFHDTTKFGSGVKVSFAYQSPGGKTVTLKVTDSAGKLATRSESFTVAPAPTTTPTPTPTPTPTGAIVRRDDCSNPDPRSLWGPAENLNGAYAVEGTGGWEHHASGGPEDKPFRRSVLGSGGKRCELAYNTWVGKGDAKPNPDPAKRASTLRTFWNYVSGDHLVTEWWLRLGSDYPLSSAAWQNIAQMKQAGPYPGEQGESGSPSSLPVLHFEARRGALELSLWGTAAGAAVLSCPITTGTWYPIRVDALYSPDKTKGRISLKVGGVQSVTKTMETLDPNGVSAFPGWQPSDLRIGIYHDTSLPGTTVDYADIRVSLAS